MAKYGRKASRKVERAMHERKQGTLRSGSGRKVKSRKQAIAIGLSEARREGAKVPSRKRSGGRKKTSRTSSSGSSSSRTSSSRKSSSRKSSSRKTSSKKR
jgi:hypothetical protein